ncbi:hypothetical protein P7C73_g3941, partial [Tremellales sp. Uapishka_1]
MAPYSDSDIEEIAERRVQSSSGGPSGGGNDFNDFEVTGSRVIAQSTLKADVSEQARIADRADTEPYPPQIEERSKRRRAERTVKQPAMKRSRTGTEDEVIVADFIRKTISAYLFTHALTMTVDHRLTYRPEAMSAAEPRAGCKYYLDDFVFFAQTSSTECVYPLCSISALVKTHGENQEAKRERIRRTMRGSGTAGDMSGGHKVKVGLHSVETVETTADESFKIWVWIRTPTSLFALRAPHALYADMFHSFWVVRQLAALLCQFILSQHEGNLHDFIRHIVTLSEAKVGLTYDVRDRMRHGLIIVDDVIYHIQEAVESLATLCPPILASALNSFGSDINVREEGRLIGDSRLVRELKEFAKLSEGEKKGKVRSLCDRPRMVERSQSLGVIELSAGSPGSRPVGQIDSGRFKWDGASFQTERSMWDGSPCSKNYFKGVIMKGQTWQINDGVIVPMPSQGAQKGIIRRLFQVSFFNPRKAKYICHVQWLASDAVLEDPRELYLKDCQCSDIPLETLLDKLDITSPAPGVKVTSAYFYRYVHGLSPYIWESPIAIETPTHCDSCVRQHRRREAETACWGNNSIWAGTEELHVNDFVFVDTLRAGEPWGIGQICKLPSAGLEEAEMLNVAEMAVEVQILDRCGSPDEEGCTSKQRLLLTDRYDSVLVSRILGKCFVLRDQKSTLRHSSSSSFYCEARISHGNKVPLRKALRVCNRCLEESARKTADDLAFAEVAMLPAADIYSGGGGSALGGKLSGYFTVISTVDMDHAACDTIQRNFGPDTAVHCATISSLRERQSRISHHELVEDAFDPRDNGYRYQQRVPFLPERGSLFSLLAGPPCQGHSGANLFQRVDDDRNEELFNALAEVEQIRPDVFVLENVAGIKRDREEGVKNFAKAAIQTLTSLDYQCRLGILDSRAYGSPQNRVRLFILASRRGLPLPHFPEPTTANPTPLATIFSLECETEQGDNGFYIGRGQAGSGPYPAVTAEDAISDLPGLMRFPEVRRFEVCPLSHRVEQARTQKSDTTDLYLIGVRRSMTIKLRREGPASESRTTTPPT